MTDPLHELELNEIANLIAARKISPIEVTRAALDRIEALDGKLHSFVRVAPDAAMAEADAAEAEIEAGRHRGPLHGVPIAIKDLFWTEGIETAGGMAVHIGFVPDEDATVVRRLKEAGAVILGKLATTESAYSDHHPTITPPKNPWHADYWTGISSSGPGVALAAGLCYGALGSDTGGSIRWPSAANGITGLKPTWGRVSRHGVFALAESMDHVGPMARSAADLAILLQTIAGADPNDPTALQAPVPDYPERAVEGVQGLRIGVDRAWNETDVDAPTRAVLAEATAVFESLGATIVDVAFPDVTQAIADWFPICAAEAAVAHEATYPARKSDYGKALATGLDAGRALSCMDYQKALLRRAAFRGRVDALFASIDLLLTPVQPFAAPTVARMDNFVEDPDLLAALARYTCAFDLTGHPTLTLPGGFTEAGLPIGFQLVGGQLAEPALLRAGVAYQGATDWHRRHPSL